jgi:hypothetical protein
MQLSRTFIAIGLVTGYCSDATAHHSFVGFYDQTKSKKSKDACDRLHGETRTGR